MIPIKIRPFFYAAALAALASGCGSGGKKSSAAVPDLEAVKRRAEAAHRGEDNVPRRLEVAPEEVAKPRVIKKGDGCSWVDSIGRVVVGDNDTRHQARAAALDEARKAAMQDVLGVGVKSRMLDFQQEGFKGDAALTESLLQTTRNGLILDEKVVAEGYKDIGDCRGCRYEVSAQICVAQAQSNDSDFHVELTLGRPRLTHGDETNLTVTATRDCHLYIYDVSADGQTAMILPNDTMPEVKIKAGQTFVFPSEEERRGGLRFVAELPEGREVSAETIRVVASRVPLARKIADPAFGGYLGILRRLHASSYEWTDDVAAFTIYKR